MSHWLADYHPEYVRNFERWLLAYDHLRARVYDDEGDLSVVDSFVPDDVNFAATGQHRKLRDIDRDYLIQPSQGESDPAFDVRKELSSYTPYYPFAVASLTGMFFGAQEDVSPTWQPEDADDGLGRPEEEDDTIAGRLQDDFDGRGNNFATVLWQACMWMIAMGELWPVVEGVERNAEGEKVGEAAVRLFPPLQVGNWLESNSRLVEAKTRILVDERSSLDDIEAKAEQLHHVVYDTDGWRQFRLVQEDGDLRGDLVAEDSYEYYRTAEQSKRILPIYRTPLPLEGNPGYNAAREANTVWNLESSLDFELYVSSIAKFIADVADEDGVNDELWDDVTDGLKNGDNVLPGGDHKYISPPATASGAKETRIENRVKRFFRTFFQQFGDATRERTATEIRQESRSGVNAFLNTLAHGLENMVNEALWRLEQVYFPDRPELWGQASWTANKDFDPVDLEDQIEDMVDRIFPQGRIPASEEMGVDLVQRYAKSKDMPIPEEDDIRGKVDAVFSREEQAGSTLRDFPA